MMTSRLSMCLLLLCFGVSVFGQTPEDEIVRYEAFPFIENGTTLSIPYAGGMTSPLYTEADLNNDGINDFFIFDRVDASGTYILRNGANDYVSGFSGQKYLPVLTGFALMYDFNCDGVSDLFTAGLLNGEPNNRITVYSGNFNSDNELQFTLVTNELTYDNDQGLFSFTDNIPSIVDIDGDGDLDILTFKTTAGKQVAYYKNTSMEQFGNCDNLVFELITDCHGEFSDDGMTPLTLNTDCNKLDGGAGNRHGVSSLLSFDHEDDGLYELMIGNEFYNTVSVLFNDGTAEAAHYYEQDNAYPSNTTSMDIQSLPTPSMVDANMDGNPDILISNRSSAASQNYACTKLYQRDELGEYDLVSDTFLIKNMVDMGEFAAPVFVDFDQDGLIDLLIGNSGYFNPISGLAGSLTAYKNVGDANNPVFQLIDRNFLNIAVYDWNFLAPAFGDIDGDGDEDMILGEGSGKIHLFVNDAGPGNPISFGTVTPNYFNIDIQKNATPQIVDLNRDGLLDLVIGTNLGYLVYYPNNGTIANAVFDEEILQLGQVDTRVLGTAVGFSAPVISEFETPGSYLLYAGSESGVIFRYDNIEGNLNAGDAFTELNTSLADINVGTRTRLDLADIDNDDILEMVITNSRGGIGIYKFGESTPVQTIVDDAAVSIYPNPITNHLFISGPEMEAVESVEVYNVEGKLISSSFQKYPNLIRLNGLDALTGGIYFVEIVWPDKILSKKVVKLGY